MRLERNWKMAAWVLAGLACVLCPVIGSGTLNQAVDDATLFDAICPIVYPVDQSASDRGFHYLFYGNGFFVNSEGYLITAAHVLSQLHGGQPYILLHQPSSEFHIAPATLTAIDREHDVAILRVMPNPFAGNFKVSFLSLSPDRPSTGDNVLSAALLPSKPREAYTLNATIEMRARGEILDSEFSQLEKGKGDTELLIFSHEIALGQSGAPVLSTESRKVVGLVEGQWFGRNTLAMLAAEHHALGAILPVHYAIALLQQKHIAWNSASSDSENDQSAAEPSQSSSAPVALSLVPAAYPSQSIFGGEVLLDALVNSTGILADIKPIYGETPYLEKALVAVRTWTFLPPRHDDHMAGSRIGIVFDFVPRLNNASILAKPRNFGAASTDSAEHNSPDSAPFPVVTVEPEYPSGANTQGSVILYAAIDGHGQLDSVKVLRGLEPFTSAAIAALRQWRFTPAKHSGANIASPVIVVFTFAQPLVSPHPHASKSSQ
ncbi:MAG: trypsin-like peptidase domain-containing protein [Candidatus Acidiferrales bacterium]